MEAKVRETPFFGVKLEDPGINPGIATSFLAVAGLCRVIRRIRIVNGSVIPGKGPALIVFAPHATSFDPPLIYDAIAVTAKRSIRMIAADYVVDPNLPQDPKGLEKTG